MSIFAPSFTKNPVTMETKKRLFLLAAALCMATGMMAQYLYDASGGRTIGKISGNRIYDASGGYTIGQINGERIMDGSGGRTLNYIKSNGQVMDSSGGYTVGYIRNNGQVMDKSGGYTLGYVENGYVYDKSHGTKIGQYRGVDVKYVAYYYFFFPNRKVNNAATKPTPQTTKQPTPQTTKVTNALDPPVKQTALYDRDKRKIGTLYGKERFVSATKGGYVFTFVKTGDGITINLRDKYFCEFRNDTIFYNNGKSVYGVIDKQGTAFEEDGSKYGWIEDDGRIAVDSKRHPNCTLGYVTDKDFDRQTIGIMYFVCYYQTLFDIYAELDKQKAQADSIKAAQAQADSVK